MIHAVRGARIWRGCYNRATVGNFVLIAFLGRGKRNLAVVGLALLLSCCTNQSGARTLLLGHPWDADAELDTSDNDADQSGVACRKYGFYPGTQQWDECIKYVGSKRPLLRP